MSKNPVTTEKIGSLCFEIFGIFYVIAMPEYPVFNTKSMYEIPSQAVNILHKKC